MARGAARRLHDGVRQRERPASPTRSCAPPTWSSASRCTASTTRSPSPSPPASRWPSGPGATTRADDRARARLRTRTRPARCLRGPGRAWQAPGACGARATPRRATVVVARACRARRRCVLLCSSATRWLLHRGAQHVADHEPDGAAGGKVASLVALVEGSVVDLSAQERERDAGEGAEIGRNQGGRATAPVVPAPLSEDADESAHGGWSGEQAHEARRLIGRVLRGHGDEQRDGGGRGAERQLLRGERRFGRAVLRRCRRRRQQQRGREHSPPRLPNPHAQEYTRAGRSVRRLATGTEPAPMLPS